jgi:deoxyribonuclease-4
MAARSAIDLGCETFQVFSRSPRGGAAKALDVSDVAEFQRLVRENGITPCIVHAPYYLNLASPDGVVIEYTQRIIAEDVGRARALGASYLVLHMGHSGAPDPIAQTARMLDSVFREAPDDGVLLLLENTAGQGKEIGTGFGSIADVISRSRHPERLGFCLDTCHAHAAGYDLSTRRGLDATLSELERTLGLPRLKLIHANDSKEAPGSCRDRHEDIGEGYIGKTGFRMIMNTPGFDGLPAILETPVSTTESNRKNITMLKSLRSAPQ